MIKLKQSDILSLIKDKAKGKMSIKELCPTNFRDEKYRASAAHYIFVLSTQIDISSKTFQNLLQFFILSLNDCVINSSDTSNQTAFQYAVYYLNDPIDEVKIEESYEKATSAMVAEFFSKIKVLSDWSSEFSSSLKIDNGISLKELATNLLATHQAQTIDLGYTFKSLTNMVPDFSVSFGKLTSLLAESKKIEELVQGQTATSYYLSLLKENKPTHESCDFFCLVVKEWGYSTSLSKEINEKLNNTLHFLKDEIKTNPQLTVYTNDLFLKHIPQLITYIEALKKKGNFEPQIKMVESYVDKINEAYVEHLNFKMDVYKKFLQEKLSGF